MVKAYLRYAAEARWGVVVSQAGHVAADPTGRTALAPALDAVLLWNLKQGAPSARLQPDGAPSEVTALELAADGVNLAVGHADGCVRLWRLDGDSERVKLTGHSSAVCALRFSKSASLLLSGSFDTNVIIWDAVAETGICRLRGHKGAVTDVCHLEALGAFASVGKDGLLKLWDMHTQHCVQTAAAPSNELWSVDADPSCERLLTGGAAAEILVWRVEERPVVAEAQDGAEKIGGWRAAHAELLGSLDVLCSSARVARLRFGLEGTAVAVQFADRNLQLWGVQSAVQLKRQAKRRQAKLRRVAEGTGEEGQENGEAEQEDADGQLTANDMYQPLCRIRAAHKLHSFAFAGGKTTSAGEGDLRPKTAKLLVADRSNSMRIYSCEMSRGGAAEVQAAVEMPGHSTEPRCLSLSADDRMVLSAADGNAKVWSIRTQQCVRTVECGYSLCATFVLASKFAVIGTKAGELQSFCLASGERVHELSNAHSGAIWSVCVQPSGTSLLTASADKSIAIWNVKETGKGQIQLSLERRLALGDDVMSACFTADAKYVVAAMLDASIRVVFFDSFKQYLTLYGHKLPVLSVSASSDNSLIVSGAADKSIKIWGLDFGDCHRSLLGHQDSVMCVKFVRETHYFFSCGKDKMIKYWDADRFEQILALPGHHAEVWAIAPSRGGDFLVSVSRDRSLRLWRRTEEQVFVEEEREAELEQIFEAGLEKQQQVAEAEEDEAELLGMEGGRGEAGAAGRRTIESVKGAERVLEALKVLEEEDERVQEFEAASKQWIERSARAKALGEAPPKKPELAPNLLLLNLDVGAYLLKALSSVRAAELDQALLLLPFDAVQKLLQRLLPLVPKAPHAELMARCILFLLKVHHKTIVANQSMLLLLHQLDASLRARLECEQATIGYNLSAMRFIQRDLEQKSSRAFFEDVLASQRAKPVASTAELRRQTTARKRGKTKS